jgi:hypothetical protein
MTTEEGFRIAVLGSAGPLTEAVTEYLLAAGLSVVHETTHGPGSTAEHRHTFPFGRESRELLQSREGLHGLIFVVTELHEVPLVTAALDRLAPGVRVPGCVVIVAPSVTLGWHPMSDPRREAQGLLAARTRALARGLAPGIRVNLVAPGPLDSSTSPADGAAIPLRRPGTAEDVAAAVAFLCSSGASFLTGAVLTVDGGAGLRWTLADYPGPDSTSGSTTGSQA